MGRGARWEAQRAGAPTRFPASFWKCAEFALEWMDEPWDDVARAGDWLLALEERDRPDVVHLNGYVHGAAALSRPCLVAAHSCVLSWWAAVHG